MLPERPPLNRLANVSPAKEERRTRGGDSARPALELSSVMVVVGGEMRVIKGAVRLPVVVDDRSDWSGTVANSSPKGASNVRVQCNAFTVEFRGI